MKKSILLFWIMVGMIVAAPVFAVESIKPKYLIEVIFYKWNSPITQSNIMALKYQPIKIPQMDYWPGGNWVLNIDNIRVEIKDDKILWNGKPNPPEALSDRVFSIPPVMALPAQDITIETISSPVQYFLKRADGVFLLQDVPKEKWPGIKLSAKIEPSAEPNKTKINLKLKYSRLIRRAPIEGVSLDVGEPEFLRYETEDAIYTMPIAQWVVFLPEVPELKFALIIRRAE